MNTINIGFLAHGPASANSLKPLIDMLSVNKSNAIFTYAYHEYVANLWQVEKVDPERGYPETMKDLDILLYGTGSSNPIETGVVSFCKRHKVVTISILDLFWSSDKGIKSRFPISPDFLIVPNRQTATQAERVMPDAKVLPYGNPHFDRLQNLTVHEVLQDPLRIALFTQCSTVGDYSKTSAESELSVIEVLEFRDKYPELVESITIRPHPREDLDYVKKLCEDNNIIFTLGDSMELLLESDFVYGDTCTLQYEALLIGKPVGFFREEVLEETILMKLGQESKPQLITVGATIRCLMLISEIIDDMILKQGKYSQLYA